jgi:hypothetical protein
LREGKPGVNTLLVYGANGHPHGGPKRILLFYLSDGSLDPDPTLA